MSSTRVKRRSIATRVVERRARGVYVRRRRAIAVALLTLPMMQSSCLDLAQAAIAGGIVDGINEFWLGQLRQFLGV